MTPNAARVGRLWPWQRVSIFLVMLLVAVTGVVYFGWRDVFDLEPGGIDRTVLILHGIGGFLALMGLGSVLPFHVRITWTARKNRLSGAITLAALGVLCISALGLYYGTEAMHNGFKWTHIVLGLAAVAVFPLHIVLGRRKAVAIQEAQQAQAAPVRRYG